MARFVVNRISGTVMTDRHALREQRVSASSRKGVNRMLRCLFGRHDWRFAYNHGMPLGISTEDALKMFERGETYTVYQCTKCPKQSRLVDGQRVMLHRSETEVP